LARHMVLDSELGGAVLDSKVDGHDIAHSSDV
jgi:hypothetical protein